MPHRLSPSPGPWKCIHHQSDVNFTHTILDAEGERLARVYALSHALGREKDESANSVLMAAAPELFDGLVSCLEAMAAQEISGPKVRAAEKLIERVRSSFGKAGLV